MLNKTMLIGNLGADVDIRYTKNQVAVATFRVATTERWRDAQGNPQEATEWHRIVAFAKLAEICGAYLAKGARVYIEGRLQTREWEKDGVKRYTTEIVVDMNGSMQLLGGRGGNADEAPRAPRPAPAARPQQNESRPASQPAAAQPASDYDSFDDDIPF